MPAWAIILLCVGGAALFGLVVVAAVYGYIVYQLAKGWSQS